MKTQHTSYLNNFPYQLSQTCFGERMSIKKIKKTTKKHKKKKIVILISGLSGSGKSVVSQKVAKKLKLKMVHTSGVLRQLLTTGKFDFKNAKMNKGFWESKKGKTFNKLRLANQSIDKKLDRELLKLIHKGGIVMDSWTMPWLSNKGIKIWLQVSDKVRGKRVSKRDKISAKKAIGILKRKEKAARQIYRKAYGFEFGKNLEGFDLILNVDKLSITQVVNKIVKFVHEKTKN